MAPQVSVVIPTYKRPDYIERCLKALLTQELAPEAFEVIVVDDAIHEETRQRVEEIQEQAQRKGYTIRYLRGVGARNKAHSPAAARNRGWRAARGAIIAFTYDDCIPEQRWLGTALTAFQQDIAAISGRVVTPLAARPTEHEYTAAQNIKRDFCAANCFYRRATLEQVNGFDETFYLPWREDSDLYFTLLARHDKCIFLHDAAVMHPVRPVRWGSSIAQQRKTMYDALLFKKHPLLYRQHIQRKPQWRNYSIVGALIIALLAAFADVWLLCALALCAWLIMTLLFAIQRLYRTKHTAGRVCEILVTSAAIPPLAIFWHLWGALRFRVLFL